MAVTRRDIRILWVLGILIVVLLIALISTSGNAQVPQTQKLYEYKYITIETISLQTGLLSESENRYEVVDRFGGVRYYHVADLIPLTELGKDGWKVVTMASIDPGNHGYGYTYICLMREVSPATVGDSGNGDSSGLLGDLDNDGDVDFKDFLVFVENFGKTLTG